MLSGPRMPQHVSRTVGVFDSGVGGEAVARAIRTALPELTVITVSDAEHIPYGDKPPEVLLTYVIPKLGWLVDQGCEVIVIACNTVTTTLIERLRDAINIPLVGMEPMVKPASELTKSKVIGVCATPNTLKSKRYGELKELYAVPASVEVVEPDCSDWARMIEADEVDREKIHDTIEVLCAQKADVVVLGCTHYHWIEDMIRQEVAGRAAVLQAEAPVITQLTQVLARLP